MGKLFDFFKTKEAAVVVGDMPSKNLVDPLEEVTPMDFYDTDRSCVVATHSVDNVEELLSFAAGYNAGVTSCLPSTDGGLKDDTFREFMAGFYVSMMEREMTSRA